MHDIDHNLALTEQELAIPLGVSRGSEEPDVPVQRRRGQWNVRRPAASCIRVRSSRAAVTRAYDETNIRDGRTGDAIENKDRKAAVCRVERWDRSRRARRGGGGRRRSGT